MSRGEGRGTPDLDHRLSHPQNNSAALITEATPLRLHGKTLPPSGESLRYSFKTNIYLKKFDFVKASHILLCVLITEQPPALQLTSTNSPLETWIIIINGIINMSHIHPVF